jgi:hypothetical protein
MIARVPGSVPAKLERASGSLEICVSFTTLIRERRQLALKDARRNGQYATQAPLQHLIAAVGQKPLCLR